MANLTVQDIVEAGLNPSYAACDAAGDEFDWDRYRFIHVKNGDASSHTVTVASQRDAKPGFSVNDLAVSIPAGEERLIGVFPSNAYRDANGKVQISYDAVTSMTIAVFNF